MFSFIKNLDWRLNIGILILISASLISLASTSKFLFHKQLLWLGLGLLLAFLVVKFNWRPFINYRGVTLGFYLLIVGLLVLTLFFATPVRGTKSWLNFGGFEFQPSELAKLALIILYADFFSKKHVSIARIKNLAISFIHFAIPAGLTALQPDFGSILILFSIWFGFLLVSGIRLRHLIIFIVVFSLLAIVMWQYFLKDYQRERILGFLFPGRDPLGINYSVIQSKIAIGSAGFFGKGFGQGTQVQLGFLPERQTDFIFAAIIEEWGVFLGLVLVFVFAYLLFRIIRIGLETENNFNRFICLGTVIFWSAQFILNIGSNLGLTPVVGLTLPFLSYGGSSLLTNLVLVGIIQSIYTRRSL